MFKKNCLHFDQIQCGIGLMKLWNKHGHWINDWLTGRLTYWSTDCVLKRLWSLCVAMELSTFTSFACYSTTLCMNPEACELRQWVTTIVESSLYKRCWTGACHRLLKFESDLSIRLWVSSLGQMFYFYGEGDIYRLFSVCFYRYSTLLLFLHSTY